MTEYPLKATKFDTFKALQETHTPGGYTITPIQGDGDNELYITYCCPCGCGRIAPLRIGYKMKPSGEDGPTWLWNGDYNVPHLEPSINHIGHWHGWLHNGLWVLA